MRGVLLLVLMLTGSCAQQLGELRLSCERHLAEPKLRFLGVGGVLIRWRDDGVLFDPFFSRPSVARLFWLKPDVDEIERRMPPAGDVTMLLVGHGHYDHLLDVAQVMHQKAPRAVAYASTTARHILRAELPAERVIDAQPAMAVLNDGIRPRIPDGIDPWFYSATRRIRALAIQSMHAPNLLTPLMGGEYPADLQTLPRFFWQWKEGQTLAWLVDLLDESGQPVYRIHYQDSASSAPYGFPPALADGKAVDIEILPVASFQSVEHYPTKLLELTRPPLVVLTHWEDFVGGTPDDPLILRMQKNESQLLEQPRKQLSGIGRVAIPCPLSEVAFAPPRLSTPGR